MGDRRPAGASRDPSPTGSARPRLLLALGRVVALQFAVVGEFLWLAVVFAVAAVLAGLAGLGGVAGLSMRVARLLALVFVVLAVIALVD